MVESGAPQQLTGAAAADQGKGVGSIWNKNSWHWEERNYTELAKKILADRLVKIALDSPAEQVHVRIYEVKSIEGTCTITIRKQKQIFLFEFKMELYFDSIDKTGVEEERRMGRLLVDEFNQDDTDQDIDFSVVCEKPGEFTARTKRALQSQVKKEVLRVIGELRTELQQIDANEEKLRRDAIEREEAMKGY
jgi:activator of HSP90 ATPase